MGLSFLRIGKVGGVTLSGSTGENVIVMDKHGLLDIAKDLTLTLGSIMLNNHNDLNAPYIQFHIAATTPKIIIWETSQTIKTDDGTTINQINVTKNFNFDMSDAPTSPIGLNTFTVASFP